MSILKPLSSTKNSRTSKKKNDRVTGITPSLLDVAW